MASICGVKDGSSAIQLWRHLRTLNLRVQSDLTQSVQDTLDLTLPEFEILLQLFDEPEWRLRMSALAESAGLSRSRLTHTVGRLEHRGLVTRFTCGSDRRGVHCRLTEKGAELVEGHADRHRVEVERKLSEPETVADLQEITRLVPQVLR